MALNEGATVTVEVKGLSELEAKLEALPVKVAKRGLRKALRDGGNIFKGAMFTLAPRWVGPGGPPSGFLAEHFGVKIKMERNELAGTAYIGPQGKVDYPDFESGAYRIKRVGSKIKKVGRIAVATVARFLEFGTSKMAKKPFMTQAFDSYKQAALDAVTESLKESLED